MVFVSGQLRQGNGSTGDANLSIPISGPKAKGSIRAVAQSTGVWRFTYLQVSIDGQRGKPRSVVPPTARRERLLVRPKCALSNALEMETAFLWRTTQVE